MHVRKKLKRKSELLFISITLFFFCGWPIIGPADEDKPSAISDFLNTPENAIVFMENLVAFWDKGIDNENGGYNKGLDRVGNVVDTKKSMLTQARTAYALAKTFQVSGKQVYLEKAHEALNVQYQHTWDEMNNYTGWLVDFEKDWTERWTSNNNKKKHSFYQHYGILGIRGVLEVHPNDFDQGWYEKSLNSLENLWDAETKAYYNLGDRDWSKLRKRGFHSAGDGITVHGLADYLFTGAEAKRERVLQNTDNLTYNIVAHMEDLDVIFGFPEEYETNWWIRYEKPNISVGHMLKAAWALAEVYRIEQKPEYKEASEKLLDQIRDYYYLDPKTGNKVYAYDKVNGGVYSIFHWSTGERQNEDEKVWWMQEEAFNAGMSAWYNGGDDSYFKIADESLNFFIENFIDDENGGVFHSTYETGEPRDTRKGHHFKAMYHSAELGYYAYLYGKLFYHNEPATLYYQLDVKTFDYDVTLTPLPMAEGCLKIEDVEIDGEKYENFDEETRTITIAAGVGGIAKVQFEIDDDCGDDFVD